MTTALAEAPRPQLAMTNGMMQPTNIDEAFRLAKAIAASGLAPRGFERPESILIAVQLGAELGLKPMQSLQSIAVVNNRPALWGNGLQGLVLASGKLEDVEEWLEGSGDDLTAHCKVTRKGVKTPRIGTFSIADAKRAGLMQKDTYQKYPNDMLMNKARARAYKLFADVLCGLPVYEDIQDVTVTVDEPRRIEAPPQNDPLLAKAVKGEVIDVTPTDVKPCPNCGSPITEQNKLMLNCETIRCEGCNKEMEASRLKEVSDAVKAQLRADENKPRKAAKEKAKPAPVAAPVEPAAVQNYTGVIATCLETSNGLFKATSTDNDVFYTKDAQVAGFLSSSAKAKLPLGIDFVVGTDGRWMIEQVKAL